MQIKTIKNQKKKQKNKTNKKLIKKRIIRSKYQKGGAAFIKIINELNKDDNKYDNLVEELSEK